MLNQSCGRCGKRVYFDNWSCLSCGVRLALMPDLMQMTAIIERYDGTWVEATDPYGPAYTRCSNSTMHQVCNGIVSLAETGTLCRACRFTAQIPSLAAHNSLQYWQRLERAKRRLLFTLAQLELPLERGPGTREPGLSFAFGADIHPGHRFVTGHCEGLISINVAEADDVERERIRASHGEPYRTLLGHFRHESGHYYLGLLCRAPDIIASIEDTFGDMLGGYDQALDVFYSHGAPADWAERHISVYAASHPQEDWAETWAHYLMIVDTLQSAAQAGVTAPPWVGQNKAVERGDFDLMLDRWLPLAEFANELARSLGNAEAYPFVLTEAIARKMRLIHSTIQSLGEPPLP